MVPSTSRLTALFTGVPVRTISETKTGALIVLERHANLSEIVRTGTTVNSAVNLEVLGTVFYEGTPLQGVYKRQVIRYNQTWFIISSCGRTARHSGRVGGRDGKNCIGSTGGGEMCIRDRSGTMRTVQTVPDWSGWRKLPPA